MACHGVLKQKAGLRLDTAARLRQGGKNGPVVVPGASAESELLDRVAATNPTLRMPPEGEGEALTTAEIETLRAWISRPRLCLPTNPKPPTLAGIGRCNPAAEGSDR